MSAIDDFIKKIKIIFDPDRLKTAVEVFIRTNYNKGLTDVEDTLELDINVQPNKEVIQFITNYTFDLIKDMNDESVGKLRSELSRGIMNGLNSKEIANNLKEKLEISKNRAKTIARTESHRAYNTGAFETAKQSGLNVKKKWYNPDPDSDVCRHLQNKVVTLDDAFTYKGESFMTPPAHPNCRSRILYIQEDKE